MCILYIVTGGLLFATSGCYATLDHDGVIVPHDVVFTSHVPRGERVHYVPRTRHYRPYYRNLRNVRHRHHHVRRHHHNRVRYHNSVRPTHRHRNQPRLKRRTVRRTYDNRGNLKRRVTTRRYY